jgi:two-component sensor histidine kinase
MGGANERAQSVREVVREANHRLANQLSMLTGMIQIQIDGLRSGPDQLKREEVLELLRSMQARIFAMGNLNRHLVSATGQDVDLAAFLSVIRTELVASLGAQARVKICETLGDGCLVSGEQATVLCLVMSEIIVNALKHARPAGHPLVLTLKCAAEDGRIVVELADDGVGLPADFDENRHGRVGFTVIRSLLRQIAAELEMPDEGPGLKFRILLPRAA